MPQLDKFIFFPQLFWLLLVLAALYLLLVGWLLPRLLRSLKFRRVHRGRLGRQTGRSARTLLLLLPSLGKLSQRPVGLAPLGLDRMAGSLSLSLAGFRRTLLPPLPLRPLTPAALSPVSNPPPLPLSPLPSVLFPLGAAPRLLPALYHRRAALLPSPLPLSPLPPPPLPLWVDVLAPLPPAPALLVLGLAARQTHWELLLWLDPLLSLSPLEELALPSLRRAVHPPLTYLPVLSLAMPFIFPLAAALLGTTLLLLRTSLSEELLLLIASTLFFGAVFNRLRPLVADWVSSQADELYTSLGALLELRLLRLGALLGLGRRLVVLGRVLDRLLVALVPLFFRAPVPTPLPSVGSLVRELAAAVPQLDRSAHLVRLRLLLSFLLGFRSLVADRLTLTPR